MCMRTWPCGWGVALARSFHGHCVCICDRRCVLGGSGGWAQCSAVFYAWLLWVRSVVHGRLLRLFQCW